MLKKKKRYVTDQQTTKPFLFDGFNYLPSFGTDKMSISAWVRIEKKKKVEAYLK